MPVLYAIVSYIAVAALLPVLLFHPKLRHGIRNRLGLYRAGENLGSGSTAPAGTWDRAHRASGSTAPAPETCSPCSR